MSKRNLTTAALFVLAALALISCQPYPPQPTGPTTVNVQQTVTVGNPGASPSPGAGGSVARVGIGKVGESCPANTQPSGRGDAVRVGCAAFLTCSPYSASNQELFDPAIIGTSPDSFGVVSGQDNASFVQRQSNGFNGDATGVKAGPMVAQCTVRGMTSPPFTLNVVP